MPEYITGNIETTILMKKNPVKKILLKKFLMKKVKHRKSYSRMCLLFIFLMSQMVYHYILQTNLLHLK